MRQNFRREITREKVGYNGPLFLAVSIRHEYRKKIEKIKNKKNFLLPCVRFLGVKLGVRKWARTVHFTLLSISVAGVFQEAGDADSKACTGSQA